MSTTNERPALTVHEIRWADALPWWLLFRAAGAAFAPTVILLATLGAVATWAGWSAADAFGLRGVDRAADIIAAAQADELAFPAPAGGSAGAAGARRVLFDGWALLDRLPPDAADVVRLARIPFRAGATLEQAIGAVIRLGWFLLVWSIFGTAISRHVALKLVGEEAPGLFAAIWYGTRKWPAAFNSVLFVLVGIAALSVPGAILGIAMRTEWGLAFAGGVWPAVLLGAVVLAILAIGVCVGWPLMVAAVGVERADSFQAISTAFSYLYQRPLHYAFYGLVALLVAVPAVAAAALFADTTANLALWATSFGMGSGRTAAVIQGLSGPSGGGGVADAWGVKAIAFWTRGVGTLLASFGWGYFWAIMTAAYVLLRRDVDGTELDEVVLDEPGTEPA
jgi:hypothetical protein